MATSAVFDEASFMPNETYRAIYESMTTAFGIPAQYFGQWLPTPKPVYSGGLSLCGGVIERVT